MVAHCHRCSGGLEEDASFCPQCAAPQLRLAIPDEQADAAEAAGGLARDPRGVDWSNVFRLALWIAIPVGILTIPPFFFPLIVAGPVVVISLYMRHRPGTLLDGRSGFRIGALMGLLAAYISAFFLAGLRLIERYPMHQGEVLDKDYALYIQQTAVASHNMAHGTAASMEMMNSWMTFFLTPDGRAWVTLLGTAVTGVGTVLLAGLGGMLGARLAGRRAATRA